MHSTSVIELTNELLEKKQYDKLTNAYSFVPKMNETNYAFEMNKLKARLYDSKRKNSQADE